LECTFAVRLVIARKVHFLNVYRAKTCRNTHTAVGSWEVSPVLQGETRQLCPIVKPFKLQGPAALSHAGENHTVPFQVDLGCHRLHLEVGWYIIWREKERERETERKRLSMFHPSRTCSWINILVIPETTFLSANPI